MRTMFKGKNETLSAKRHENGISVGIYLHDSVASFEYISGKPTLLINTDCCKECNIPIIMVDSKWQPIKK